jgi:ABC-type Na+ efflux pump permease subunit
MLHNSIAIGKILGVVAVLATLVLAWAFLGWGALIVLTVGIVVLVDQARHPENHI